MTCDEAKLADSSLLDHLANTKPLRMRAHHERLADLDPAAIAHGEQRASVRCRKGDRFLAEHVLPGFGRPHRPGHVQVIRQRDVHDLDLRVGE